MVEKFCRSQDCNLARLCLQADAIRKINQFLGSKTEILAQIRYAKDKAAQRGCPNESEINTQAGKVVRAMRQARNRQ